VFTFSDQQPQPQKRKAKPRKKKVTQPDGRGRPEYVPTESDRMTVMSLVAAGFAHKDICVCIGPKGISEPTMRKHFAHELATGIPQINAIPVKSIVLSMAKAQPWACTLWVKNRMGWREKAPEGAVSDDGMRELAAAIAGGPVELPEGSDSISWEKILREKAKEAETGEAE